MLAQACHSAHVPCRDGGAGIRGVSSGSHRARVWGRVWREERAAAKIGLLVKADWVDCLTLVSVGRRRVSFLQNL
jgi:hypothetical protein